MKVLATLAIFSIVAVANGAVLDVPAVPFTFSKGYECPVVNGEDVTLLPNPDNCSTYYACDTGVPIKMNCPPHLHFNRRHLVCDWPALACCDEKYLETKFCQNLE